LGVPSNECDYCLPSSKMRENFFSKQHRALQKDKDVTYLFHEKLTMKN